MSDITRRNFIKVASAIVVSAIIPLRITKKELQDNLSDFELSDIKIFNGKLPDNADNDSSFDVLCEINDVNFTGDTVRITTSEPYSMMVRRDGKAGWFKIISKKTGRYFAGTIGYDNCDLNICSTEMIMGSTFTIDSMVLAV